MTLRNDRRLGVRNGNRGVVLDVDPDERTMRVQLPRGEITLPARYVDEGHVGLAYAMTVNKAHGTTCDATMMLADDLLYRELAYEAMSRGRKDNRVYMSSTTASELDLRLEDGPHAPTIDADDALDILAAGFERRRNKQLALDHIAPTPIDTWSTTDLLAERRRVQAVLNEAPRDRATDLAALVTARHQVARDVIDQRLEVAKLECRTRPWRERRQPDHDLTRAQHRLDEGERRLERLDHEIAGLEAGQHRRASHLAAHSVDVVELAEIDRVLDRRLHDQIVRIVNDPPTYITKTLGTRPPGGELDRHWVKAVIDIETYRQTHDITDRRTTLGPQPPASDTLARLDWHQATWTIDDARERLLPPTPSAMRPAPEPRVPSLGIEL